MCVCVCVCVCVYARGRARVARETDRIKEIEKYSYRDKKRQRGRDSNRHISLIFISSGPVRAIMTIKLVCLLFLIGCGIIGENMLL